MKASIGAKLFWANPPFHSPIRRRGRAWTTTIKENHINEIEKCYHFFFAFQGNKKTAGGGSDAYFYIADVDADAAECRPAGKATFVKLLLLLSAAGRDSRRPFWVFFCFFLFFFCFFEEMEIAARMRHDGAEPPPHYASSGAF